MSKMLQQVFKDSYDWEPVRKVLFGNKQITLDVMAKLRHIVKKMDYEHLCRGDLILPLKTPALMDIFIDINSPFAEFVREPNESTLKHLEAALREAELPVSKVWMDRHNLYATFHRPKITQEILRTCIDEGPAYGANALLSGKQFKLLIDGADDLASLRGRKVANHIGAVVALSGGEVKQQINPWQTVHETSQEDDDQDFVPLQSSPPQTAHETSLGDGDQEYQGPKDKMVEVSQEDSNYESTQPKKQRVEATQEESSSAASPDEIELCVTKDSFSCPGVPKANRFVYMPLVDMKTNKAWRGSTQEFCRILIEELKLAAEQKHGNVESGEWMKFLEEQAQRCLTLQLLAVSHSSCIKVETQDTTRNTRESAFILYNYARLCTIFQSFEESVERQEVAPLPDIETIDFTQLCNDAEWVLVWGFLLTWPDIVEDLALAVLNNTGKFKTAAVTRYLHALSHRVSEYYSRYHVLTEPLPHLLNTMYARLYLLRAVKNVMEVCFKLLDVDSPAMFM